MEWTQCHQTAIAANPAAKDRESAESSGECVAERLAPIAKMESAPVANRELRWDLGEDESDRVSVADQKDVGLLVEDSVDLAFWQEDLVKLAVPANLAE